MTLHSRVRLFNRLKNKRFRHAFVSAQVDTGLAFQIRALRQKEGWSQADLASELGTSQNVICRLENPSYGKASISTLKKLASVFDVALVVRLVRFSTLINEVLNLSPEAIAVDKFREDKGLMPLETVVTSLGKRATTIGIDLPIAYRQSNVEMGHALMQAELSSDLIFSAHTVAAPGLH